MTPSGIESATFRFVAQCHNRSVQYWFLNNDHSRNAPMDKRFCSSFRNQGYKRQTATDPRIESHPLTCRNTRLRSITSNASGWQHKWQWDGWLNFTESVAMATQMVSCNTDELRAQYDKHTTAVSNQNITYNKRSGIKFRQTPPNGREFDHISTYPT